MERNIFDFKDYKAYLNENFKTRPSGGRGVRSALANAIGCQSAYVSQVLNGPAHFSLEQADLINQFLGHTSDESGFFLLLVQLARAGTQSLRSHFQTQIEAVIGKRLILKNRLDVKQTLSPENQAVYYSAWYYAAVHVMLSIPELQTREALIRHLRLPPQRITDVLNFLVSVKLAVKSGTRYQIGTTRIHLPSDSPLISKHHTNLRMLAIQSLDRNEEKDLHYSSVVTISKDDVLKIKSELVKNIETLKKVIRDSKEEVGYCLSFDFFGI
ncbi:MAG TPA: TIGR02147 family protein [Bdellovibrionota bacterium]|nr:TIGR02147 family protein [Bdellovibrionota bacterium]